MNERDNSIMRFVFGAVLFGGLFGFALGIAWDKRHCGVGVASKPEAAASSEIPDHIEIANGWLKIPSSWEVNCINFNAKAKLVRPNWEDPACAAGAGETKPREGKASVSGYPGCNANDVSRCDEYRKDEQ